MQCYAFKSCSHNMPSKLPLEINPSFPILNICNQHLLLPSSKINAISTGCTKNDQINVQTVCNMLHILTIKRLVGQLLKTLKPRKREALIFYIASKNFVENHSVVQKNCQLLRFLVMYLLQNINSASIYVSSFLALA